MPLVSRATLSTSIMVFAIATGFWRTRLRFEPDLGAALRQADFVQENGPEQEKLKVELFEKLDRLLAPDVA